MICFLIEVLKNRCDSCITESETRHIEDLRKLIENDLQLNRYDLNDDFLIAFLRCELYDMDKAYQRLKLYTDTIRSRPEIFTWTCDAEKTAALKMFGVSKGQSVDGCAIVVIKPSLWDPSDSSLAEIGQFVTCYTAAFVPSQAQGIHAIVDASNLTWSQLLAIGPIRGKFIGEFSSAILPIRIQKVHIIHISRLARIALKMILPFMNKRVRERVFFNKENLGEVFKCCPPSAIPIEFGGQAQDEYMFSLEDHLRLIENGRYILEDIWQQVRDDQ